MKRYSLLFEHSISGYHQCKNNNNKEDVEPTATVLVENRNNPVMMLSLSRASNEFATALRQMVKRKNKFQTRKKQKQQSCQIDPSMEGVSADFQKQLAECGLIIREVPGDGNCLFRSLSDQMIGTCDNHLIYRNEVCDFLESNRDEFEPFFENFERTVKLLQKPGVFAGNESLVAFARLKNVAIVIHQEGMNPWIINCERASPSSSISTESASSASTNESDSLDEQSSDRISGSHLSINSLDKMDLSEDDQPTTTACRAYEKQCRDSLSTLSNELDCPKELHISYHSYEHYNSVRYAEDDIFVRTPARVLLSEITTHSPLFRSSKAVAAGDSRQRIPSSTSSFNEGTSNYRRGMETIRHQTKSMKRKLRKKERKNDMSAHQEMNGASSVIEVSKSVTHVIDKMSVVVI